MAEIKFGVSQVSNPTPTGINLWVRVATIVIASFMGFMATTDIIGPNTEDLINAILGFLLALLNSLAPLFGVDLSGTSYVKTSEVSAVDSSDPKLPYSAPGDKQINK